MVDSLINLMVDTKFDANFVYQVHKIAENICFEKRKYSLNCCCFSLGIIIQQGI